MAFSLVVFSQCSQGDGHLLGVQILAAIVTAVWSFLFGFLSMLILRHFGMLKVSKETEFGGIDLFKHNGSAYPEFALVSVS